MQKCNKFKNIAIVHVKKSVYRIYFLYMSKREAKKLMNNSNLIDKKRCFMKKKFFFFQGALYQTINCISPTES